MISISEGNKYRTKGDHEIIIVKRLGPHIPHYKLGFRYFDNEGRTYKPNGEWSNDGTPSPFDIIEHISVDLILGRSYFNRLHQSIQIVDQISRISELSEQGYRFVDLIGRSYKRDGTILKIDFDEQYDLIESIPF